MTKISAKATNERRQQVWFLMLKGYNPQAMSKALNVSHVTIYNDIKCLTKKSKQYVYDLAKGTHVLMYQRAIEGIALALETAWDKFNDPKVLEKQKLGYLRLTKECNEKMFEFTANGPTEMAVLDLMRHAERLGIDTIDKPLVLSEDQQISDYIRKNPRLAGNDYTVPYYYDDNKTDSDKDKDGDGLNHEHAQ